MTKKMLALAMPAPKQRITGLLLGITSDLSMVALLVLSMWLIMRSGEQPPILHLTFAIVGVRALAIGRAVFRYLERLATHDSALKQLATLRTNTFDTLIPLIPGALKDRTLGDVHAGLVDDIDQLQDQPLRVWQPITVSSLTILVGLGIVALMSPTAAIVNVVLISFTAFLTTLIVYRSARSSDQLTHIRAELVDAIIERLQASTVLKVFGVTAEFDERIEKLSESYVTQQRKNAGTIGVTSAIITFVAGCASLLTLWLLRPEMGLEVISAPVLAAMVIVPQALFELLTALPQALQHRVAVKESATRVEEIMAATLPSEIPLDEPHLPGVATNQNEQVQPDNEVAMIECEGVNIAYPGTQPVVRDLSFTLRAGETLLLTGESGAGKSTIAKALVRFLDYSGSYRLRGVETKDLAISEVRKRVGLAEQQPHLFDADLRQNLKFAKPGATDTELMEVLARVGLDTWARSRGGLDMHVGEHGALVSGGQAARISLARVLLADFPIVVIDEPTAGVDPERSEQILIDILGAVPKDRAVIIISHTDLPVAIRDGVQHLSI